MRAQLQTDLPAGTSLHNVAAIQSGYPGYESLFYIAATVEPPASSEVAVWAANISDGDYQSGYASFVPVNPVARNFNIRHGSVVPPESDPAVAEAVACAR